MVKPYSYNLRLDYWMRRCMPGAIAVDGCGVKRTAVYQCRRLEWTAAYQVVWKYAETWLALWRAGELEAGADLSVCPVPAYVERDLH